MKKIITIVMLCTGTFCIAGQPIFTITPLAKGPTALAKGQQGTYIYQLSNTTNIPLSDIGLIALPKGVSAVVNAGYQYCTFPLTLSSHNYCLVKLTINSKQSPSYIKGGPQVCFSVTNPAYCNQPSLNNRLNTQITPTTVTSCAGNVANFNSALSQQMDAKFIDKATIQSWGPNRNHLLLTPDEKKCTAFNSNETSKINWMQQRIIAAEDYWVKQKLNYCHHHVVDFATPLMSNGKIRTTIASGQGGYCSNAINVMPGTPYYGQPVRWNYSGSGTETMSNWINNNQMWYGVDCSDFTSFVYNFAFGIQFN
ncbi:MAG: hypothetical protein PSV35_02040, partial [bacterium]|nr:hypothetical protein [bacterium]